MLRIGAAPARRAAGWLALVIVVLLAPLTLAPPTAAAPGERCFAETGFCTSGRFLAYWEANGGLTRNGYPLTPERRETLEDGKEYTVQYFERVRMEYHPENTAPYDVLLGQFGREVFRESFGFLRFRYDEALAPVPPQAGQTYFPETGHNVGPRFLAYWQANGGLAQFGYPLGEERDEGLDAGGGAGIARFRVQYFERARLEYHPENAGTPYAVLLGQFGRALATRGDSVAAPYAARYAADAQLRGWLGAPLITDAGPGGGQPIVSDLPGEYLPFEHGLMVRIRWPGGEPGGIIQILCGAGDAGAAATNSRNITGIPNPWNATLPVGGGPGPRPGTYEPQYGFGLLWSGYRDCLGYATAPAATPYQPQNQYFARGVMFTTPDGASIYAAYLEVRNAPPPPDSNQGYQVGFYQRYPAAR